MEFYWDTGNTVITILVFFWGMFCGRMQRDEKNQKILEAIQMTHIRELFRVRKARLGDLLGLPEDITQPGEIQGNSSISE